MLGLHAIPNGVPGDCLLNAVAIGLWFIGDRKNINRHFAELYDGMERLITEHKKKIWRSLQSLKGSF